MSMAESNVEKQKYTSTPSDQVYQNLTQVVPSTRFEAFAIITEKAQNRWLPRGTR